LAKAAIIGQMPAYGDVLYITSEPCTLETGKIEANWYFSYSVNSLGNVSRSCYVRYNDQIWIRGAYGTESTYPMNYFSKPAGVAGAEANEKSDPKAESKQ
jgi:hypothetical protein